jgi:hypothetical protein
MIIAIGGGEFSAYPRRFSISHPNLGGWDANTVYQSQIKLLIHHHSKYFYLGS